MTGNIKTLTIALEEIKITRKFKDFSHFIIEKMGYTYSETIGEEAKEQQKEIRQQAFAEFRQRTHREEIASLPTMRKWFGIGGKATPSREQVYQMCFVMGLSAVDAEEFLLEGIKEPSFQVNDYSETILMYGLENGFAYEECVEMIDELEERMEPDISFQQTRGTQMLLSEFKGHKHLSKEKFLDWMEENAACFKGYSKTTLDYFIKYKKIILDYVKKDAEEELSRLLAETDFENWCRSRGFLTKDPKKKIHNYIRSHSTGKKNILSDDLKESIMELAAIAYTDKNANAQLLGEVFRSNKTLKTDTSVGFNAIEGMTGKKLSDLLNVATQKQRIFHVRQASRKIKELENEEACPKWIQEMTQEYSRKKVEIKTVADAKKWMKEYLEEHKRRCLQIQRSDILPMILYVSQRRYLEEIDHDMTNYNQQDALIAFDNLANATLSACNMCQINEQYELDTVLRSCYGKEEMYTYSELLEVI